MAFSEYMNFTETVVKGLLMKLYHRSSCTRIVIKLPLSSILFQKVEMEFFINFYFWHSLESESLYVVHEAPSPSLSITCGFPKETGGIYDMPEKYGWRDVTKQSENYKLNAQSKCFFFFCHWSEDYHKDWHLCHSHQQSHEEK